MQGNTLQLKVGTQMQSPLARTSTEQQALSWSLDIARGLAHLHAAQPKIIHRDLKLENMRGRDGG